jgi:hypothetical protein
VVGVVEEVVWFGAVAEPWTPDDVGVWTMDDVGVWTPDDAVEGGTGDELAEVGLDVEEHPVRNDVVSAISAAPIGIELFICAYPSSTLLALHQDDTREPREHRR